jgi:hypothetical protein
MSIKSGSITRVFVSIAFIALGLGFAIEAAASLFDGDFEGILALNSVLGILMFVLGIMGISKSAMKACRVIAVLVFFLAMTSFIISIMSLEFNAIIKGITSTFVWAILAWVFFDIS